MQYKGLLFAAAFTLSLPAAFAQKYQDFTLSAKHSRVIKSDTIVIKPASSANKAVPLPAQVNSKKPVPLAGNLSYFGSMNDYVVQYTRKYMASHDRTLAVVKKRGEKQFSEIDKILEKHDIPKELKYLAVIESALNNNAISRVGAVGPWQFMAPTARMMGLTVNRKRDDRRDWTKSTNAAAKYLTYLYGELNDWLLVIAAYNSGPRPVLRAIERTGSKNFWDIKKYLPKETQGHVLAFIATASIFENMNKFIGLGGLPEDFDFDSFTADATAVAAIPKKPAYTDEELRSMAIVRIGEPVSLDLLAQDLKIERRLLEKWNPDYELFELSTYNAEYYSLRIPKEKLDNFIERKEFLTRRSKQLLAEMR